MATDLEELNGVELTHDQVAGDGVDLHVVRAGPSDGHPVVLLHGFPEFWYGWRHQIPALAEAGFQVWVPDQRGYNRSDKPADLASYGIDRLAADVVALVEATGADSVPVVGHDWGAGVAWWTAITHPDVVERLVAMNVPHPTVFTDHLTGDLRQLRRSWYMFFFQLPWLPEYVFRRRNYRAAVRALRGTSRPGSFTVTDIARYRTAWAQPGAVSGMINWYRAMFRRPGDRPADDVVEPPTLVVWGPDDPALREVLAPESVQYCRDGRLERIDGATHWVHHDAPDRVNEQLLAFLE